MYVLLGVPERLPVRRTKHILHRELMCNPFINIANGISKSTAFTWLLLRKGGGGN